MNKSNASLLKTCNSCGQQKSLAAFLQVGGPDGTTYGNTCSACRGSHQDNIAKPKDPDDITRSTSGLKIDAKVKVKDAIDKREHRKQVEEEYFEEREKEELQESIQFEKTEIKREDEKKHRLFEKRSFLDKSNSTPPTKAENVFGGEVQRAKEEKLDFSTGPFEDTRIAGKVKYTQSSVFRAFKDLLPNAPIVSAEERAQRSQKTANGADKTAEKKAVTDFVQETWSPSSGRRR